MNVFYGRPLALALCVSVLLSAVVALTDGFWKIFLLFVCMVALVLFTLTSFLQKRWGRVRSVAWMCLLFSSFLLFSSWCFLDYSVDDFKSRTENGCVVEGYVIERQGGALHECRLLVQTEEIGGARLSKRVLVKCSYPSSLQIGEPFRLYGVWEEAIDTDLYSESQSLLSDGCVGILRCEASQDCTVLSEKNESLFLKLRRWNETLSLRLKSAIGGEEGALASALLLGNRTQLSEDTELAFRRAGVSHLLALSGMHISVLILFLERFLYWLFVPKRLRVIGILAVSVFYLGLTGFSLSTVRAVFMVCFLYLGFFFGEKYDSFTALCSVLFLILLFMPYSIFDIGMWLSFVTTASIVIFTPVITNYYKKSEWIKRLPKFVSRLILGAATALLVGGFANAASLPIIAFSFRSASLFSVPITMLLSPLLFPALLLSLFALIFPRSDFICWAAEGCIKGFFKIVERVSNSPYALVRLDWKVTLLLVLLLAASLCVFAIIRLKRKAWVLLPILLSLSVTVSGAMDALPRSNGVAVSFFSQAGNETLILTEGRRTVVFDLSNGSSATESAILQTAALDRYTKIDELVLSHYHTKAAALLASVTGQIKIYTLRLPTPLTQAEEQMAKRLEQEAEAHGVTVVYGLDSLAISSVEVLYHGRVEGTEAECGILLSLRIREQTLTYLSAGCITDENVSLIQNLVFSSQTLLLGAHGVSADASYAPLRLSLETTRVILTKSPYWDQIKEQPAFSDLIENEATEACRFFLK